MAANVLAQNITKRCGQPNMVIVLSLPRAWHAIRVRRFPLIHKTPIQDALTFLRGRNIIVIQRGGGTFFSPTFAVKTYRDSWGKPRSYR